MSPAVQIVHRLHGEKHHEVDLRRLRTRLLDRHGSVLAESLVGVVSHVDCGSAWLVVPAIGNVDQPYRHRTVAAPAVTALNDE